MKRHAKAPSAGSIDGSGSSRGLFRRALATRGASVGFEGSGAPSSRRLRNSLALLGLAITALAATAASASAAPLAAKMGTISSVSYTSAHVTGEITSPCQGSLGFTGYSFQYATSESGPWIPGPGEGNHVCFSPFENKAVEGDINVPKAGAQYFVRLTVFNNGIEVISPQAPPYPSFTTLHVDAPSVIAIDNASEVFSLSATATGKVGRSADPNPAYDAECHFEYVSDAQFSENTGNSLPGFEGGTPVDCNHNPVKGGDGPEVEASLTGLSPSTTYHLRLGVANAGGSDTKEAANTFTTAPPVAKPTVVSVEAASEVSYKTAKAKGVVERPAGADPALDTSCRFEYITDAQFSENTGNSLPGFEGASSAPCGETPLTSPTPVTASLNGLKSGATYHLRLVAENAGGSDAKEANTFTTIPGGDPTFSIDPNSDVGYATLKVFGTGAYGIGGEDRGVQYVFEVAEVGTENWTECCGSLQTVPHEPGPGNLSYTFTGLNPDTEYKYRLVLILDYSGQEFSPEPYPTVTTRHLEAPTDTLDPVSGISGNGAHFSGTVETHAPVGPLDSLGKAAYKTSWHIECTPECPPNATLSGVVNGEEGSKAISMDATHLAANTSYEVKLVANNELYGAESTQTFQTPLIAPTVKATSGAPDGKGGYTLQGVVNPNNSNVTDCEFEWGPNSANYAFSAPCSPAPGSGPKPVTVEAHLTGLTPGATYHAKLVATNAGGSKDGGDQTFVPTLSPPEECSNDTLRAENNSLALPECRAYEQVSSNEKGGHEVETLTDFYGDDRVAYGAGGNIANSGTGAFIGGSTYVANRTSAGWETIPNLNGPTGSTYTGPDPAFFDTYGFWVRPSEDLLSSLWQANPGAKEHFYLGRRLALRHPDGSFSPIGNGISPFQQDPTTVFASADLSRVFVTGFPEYGPGLREFTGTGADQKPRRIDLDNSDNPISPCGANIGLVLPAYGTISKDNEVVSFTALAGCAGGPIANQLWVRVGGTVAYDASASLCTRTAGDPGGACNAPSDAEFKGASVDGRRVYFTTAQQLVNGDTDETSDLYACDIPPGTPVPSGNANSCSSLSQVSGGSSEARVDELVSVSEDGSTAYFVSPAVLAANEDALGEAAQPGDQNLYVWRKDAAHPSGQTTFVGKLGSDDISGETTPDGRYLVFTTATPLVGTDTDTAADVYRYDADTGEIVRASTNIFGLAGNGEGFDAKIQGQLETLTGYGVLSSHQTHVAVSSDGSSIIFTTSEGLSPLDGNEEPDAYLWHAGHVSLISTGSVGGGAEVAAISESGRDIFFLTSGALTPGDGDFGGDVYDARIGGGFRFGTVTPCSGEACQPPAPVAAPAPAPASAKATGGEGNFKPCAKGKVMRKGRCVEKQAKKKHKGKGKKAGHKSGGGK